MAKVEDLHGVGHDLLHQVPAPVCSIGQHEHFGRLRPVGLLRHLRDDWPKCFTIRGLCLEDLGQQLMALLAPFCHLGLREGHYRLSFPLPLILGPLPGLSRRTQVPINWEINPILLPLPSGMPMPPVT